MATDPFFQSNLIWSPSVGDCEARCPQSGRGGFCGVSIHPACLRIGRDGSVRVGLSATPQDWFGMLSGLGDVLHLTRNHLAVLGQIGPVPEVNDWRQPVLPRDTDGWMSPNLAEHASVWAVREPSSIGMAYGFETRDASGHAFQRIVLTAPARRELFERFVTEHQSPPEEAAGWFSPNSRLSTQRCRAIEQRVGVLRARLQAGASQIRQMPVESVSQLFRTWARERLSIRTTHYTRALIRAAVWTPDADETVAGSTSEIQFYHGDNAGLHLHLASIGSVWLWQGRCACCEKEQWTLELADAAGHVSLAISAGNEHEEARWREILLTVQQLPW